MDNRNPFLAELEQGQGLVVSQRRELAELIGFESRNKYEIAGEGGRSLGYAAEQQKDALGFLMRQWLGHWRTFDITFFDHQRQPVLVARHPFRFFLQRLEVYTPEGAFLGALQQRWSLLSKRFDMEDARGRVVLTVSAPFWQPWTFTFQRDGREVAVVKKKWSGFLKEAFTDADNFRVEFLPGPVSADERRLLLAAALFIDLQYFENKAD